MASIFLAIGHGVTTDGNWDSGCVYNGYNEAALMYPIVGVAVNILRSHGVTVGTDWDTGNDRNMTYTVRDANADGYDYYMSVHCDYSGAPSGTLPIIHPNSSGGYAFANAVNNAYMEVTGLGTRGILRKDDYEVAYTDMTACIFETGSIRADINTLLNSDLCGTGLAKGILSAMGIPYNGSTPTPQPPQQGGNNNNPRVFTSIFNSDYYLSYGDGPDPNIGQFQRDCQICGYWGENGSLIVDNLYGSECVHACECIQRLHGLEIDGKYGRLTDLALMKEVATIQAALNKFGYNLTVDGASGPATVNALKDFQAKHGLVVDGIVGKATLSALGIG